MWRGRHYSHHIAPSSAALLCTADLLLYPGNLWVRRHLGVSTVVVRAHDRQHGDTRCYQGWPTSGSGPLIEYTSLDKLGYRCKDDLSSVSGVAGLVLDPCGVDTWSPHVLWLGWCSSPLSGEDVRLESAGEARRLVEMVALWLCHAVQLSSSSVVQLLPCLC